MLRGRYHSTKPVHQETNGEETISEERPITEFSLIECSFLFQIGTLTPRTDRVVTEERNLP
jgi:hypothetical protein